MAKTRREEITVYKPRPKKSERASSRCIVPDLDGLLAAAVARHGGLDCKLLVDRLFLRFYDQPIRIHATWSGRSPLLPEICQPYDLVPWYRMGRHNVDRARNYVQTLFWEALVRGKVPSPLGHADCFLVLFQAVADGSWETRVAAGKRTGRSTPDRVLPEFLLTYQMSQNWGELLRRYRSAVSTLGPRYACLSHAAADHVAINISDKLCQKSLGRVWAVVEDCGKDALAQLKAIRGREQPQAARQSTNLLPNPLLLCPEAEQFLERFVAEMPPLPPSNPDRGRGRMPVWTPYHQRALHSCLVALIVSLDTALREIENLAKQARAAAVAAGATTETACPPSKEAVASLWDAGYTAASRLVRLSLILSQPDIIELYKRHIAVAAAAAPSHPLGYCRCCAADASATPSNTRTPDPARPDDEHCMAGLASTESDGRRSVKTVADRSHRSSVAPVGTNSDRSVITMADVVSGVVWMADANLALQMALDRLTRERSRWYENYLFRGRLLQVLERSE